VVARFRLAYPLQGSKHIAVVSGTKERFVAAWKVGELELEGKARVSINREPTLTITIDWEPSADAYAKAEVIKDEWLRGGPYEFSTPAGDAWTVTPSEWVETPGDNLPPSVRIKLRSAIPEGLGPDGTPLELLMDAEASPEEKHAVAEVLREFRCEPGDIADLHRRSIGDLPWQVMVETTLRSLFDAFVGAFGGGAAVALMSLVKKIFKARDQPGRDGSMVFIDKSTHIHIVVSAELPEEAYQRLLDLDLASVEGESGQLRYNQDSAEWEDAVVTVMRQQSAADTSARGGQATTPPATHPNP